MSWLLSPAAGTISLGDLANVNLTGAATGDMLYYNGTNWVDTDGDLTWDGTNLTFQSLVLEYAVGLDDANGYLLVQADDPYNNEFGFVLDVGGWFANRCASVAETQAGAKPAAGDAFGVTSSLITSTGDYLTDFGFYGDDILQIGSYIEDADTGFFITRDVVVGTYEYPLWFDATNNALTVTDGWSLRVGDSGGGYSSRPTDYANFSHDDTDFNTAFVNTADWNITGNIVMKVNGRIQGQGGFGARIYDSTNADYGQFYHTGSHFQITTAGTGGGDLQLSPAGSNVDVINGKSFRIRDSANTDIASFSHDGTDFNTSFTNTTDWNITGITSIVTDADSIKIAETTAAPADTTGYGQIWVDDASPNTLMFTDDTGNDINLIEELWYNGTRQLVANSVGVEVRDTLYVGDSGTAGVIKLGEQASADVDESGYGQIWVRSSDGTLMYTADDGTDYVVDLTAA